ncbi:MAG: cob(I)yrinic acid a,c-diamide adenosyltransferase [Firmicutes bacterium]|jgi:cob(I)alamin adenosyltransferase|nr:cob(I)yrinic acid a,c-diamide adenosyltransferase [Bacillota bacterium]
MKIYTKRGDRGETTLFGGEKVRKDDFRVETYGTLDEAVSILGLARAMADSSMIKNIIKKLQKDIYKLNAELASTPNKKERLPEKITKKNVIAVEKIIDCLDQRFYMKKDFVLAGSTSLSAVLDMARTVVRRAERRAVTLNQKERLRGEILEYLNRLSDLLYILARFVDQEEVVRTVKEKVLNEISLHKTTPQRLKLGLSEAKRILQAAENKAKAIGVSMVISVVDKGGNLIALHRMDGSLLASIDISINKAFTAVSLKMPTHVLAKHAQPGESLYGIDSTNNGRIVVFGGGIPLEVKGDVVGGIGVSGGSVEQDIAVAEAGVKIFQEIIKGS